MHPRYFIGYVYNICLQDTIQSKVSLCLLCQTMLLPLPLRPLPLTTRSGFMVAEAKMFRLCRAFGIAESHRSKTSWTKFKLKSAPREGSPRTRKGHARNSRRATGRSPRNAQTAWNGVPASEDKGHPDRTARHTRRRKRGAGRGKRARHNTQHRPQPPRTGCERRAHTPGHCTRQGSSGAQVFECEIRKTKEQVEQEQDVDRINEWFEIQCNTEGLQIDNAGINTKVRSQMDSTKDVM